MRKLVQQGRVVFNYSYNTLQLIQVKDSDGNSKRSIYLYHHRPDTYGLEDHVMLDSVIIKDGSGTTLEAYRLGYNSPLNIKGREKSINFWGYMAGTGRGSNAPLLNNNKIKILGYFSGLFGDQTITVPGGNMEIGASERGTLKSITNHLGGITNFFYESDKYVKLNSDGSKSQMYDTGGLRIARIRYSDPILNENIERVIKYGQSLSSAMYSEDGMGVVRRNIAPDCYMYEQDIENVFPEHLGFNKMQTYTSNLSGNCMFSSDLVAYDRVSEYRVAVKDGVEINNGKTVYYYNYPLDSNRQCYPSDTVQWIAGTNIVFDKKDTWKYGQLMRKEVYANNNSLLSKTEYTYDLYSHPRTSCAHVWGIYKSKIYQIESTNPMEFERGLLPGGTYAPYRVWSYDIVSGCMRLTSQKEYQFFESPVTKTINYSYRNSNLGYPTTIETIYSNDLQPVTKNIKYVEDDISADDPQHVAARSLLLKHGKTSAIMEEEITIGNTKQVNRTKYKIHENNLALPYQQITQRDNHAVEERATIHNYDYYGNPLYTTKDGANQTVYIWGYQGRFPVAIIQNITFDQASMALGGEAFFDQLSKKEIPIDADWQKIEQLRITFPQSHVSIFFHDKFTGKLLWKTDSRGVRIYYDYDTDNRLTRIYYKEKDIQGFKKEQIIETYDYQYRNY